MNLTELVVDMAGYTGDVDPLPLLDGGVKMAIVKSSGGMREDPAFRRNGEILAKGGLPIAAYHWIDPTYPAAEQVDFAAQLWQDSGLPILAVFGDFEQWWKKWGDFWDALKHKLPWRKVEAFPGGALSAHARACMDLFAGHKPAALYTSQGFVKEHAPQAKDWIGEWPLWVANYGKYPTQDISWQTLRENYLPTFEPALPPGAERVVGHQFTGDALGLPGMYVDASRKRRARADVSLFSAAFLQEIGAVPDPKPLPQPRYTGTVTAYRLRVRRKPVNGETLYTLPRGERVEVLEIREGWARLRAYDERWCSAKYLSLTETGNEPQQPPDAPVEPKNAILNVRITWNGKDKPKFDYTVEEK